jgi:hypothetical protein
MQLWFAWVKMCLGAQEAYWRMTANILAGVQVEAPEPKDVGEETARQLGAFLTMATAEDFKREEQ